jgi:hypothetical protein
MRKIDGDGTMAEQNKHACKVLVCPDCGAKYSARKVEMLAFDPFHAKRKGKRGEARE